MSKTRKQITCLTILLLLLIILANTFDPLNFNLEKFEPNKDHNINKEEGKSSNIMEKLSKQIKKQDQELMKNSENKEEYINYKNSIKDRIISNAQQFPKDD